MCILDTCFRDQLKIHCESETVSHLVVYNFLPPQVQAPLSMEFSREEYCSRVPFPPPGDLPDPGIEPSSPTLVDKFFYHLATREAHVVYLELC